jgi:UDP-glucose 4-epimerase
MEVAIIGSEGYIGTNLKNYLEYIDENTELDIEISCYDYELENEDDLIGDDAIMSAHVVVNLGAVTSIPECETNKKQAFFDNVSMPVRLFHRCVEESVHLIHMSSQAAKEPSNFYGLTKWMLEQEADRLNNHDRVGFGYEYIHVLRLANVYGGKNYIGIKPSVISKMTMAKVNDEDIIINGDGSQTRDFIHVYDVCDSIFKIIQVVYNDVNSHSAHDAIQKLNFIEPIDIGTGKATSILDLAKMFNHKFTYNKESNLVGVSSNIADIEPAKNFIGFEAKRKLEDYMKGV